MNSFFPFNFPFIVLNSVGTVIVPESGNTYPMPESGYVADCEFAEDEAVHISECSDEWFESLDSGDSSVVEVILNR